MSKKVHFGDRIELNSATIVSMFRETAKDPKYQNKWASDEAWLVAIKLKFKIPIELE